MQIYWLYVFNQQPLGNIAENNLIPVLLEVNFNSLCHQYGLDSSMIAPALSQLELRAVPEGVTPFNVLKYQADDQPPILIFQWDTDKRAGADRLGDALMHVNHPRLRDHLKHTCEILGISLLADQLDDIGLVLAYEVARWAAFNGQGLVFGLDSVWYRLNRHQAFIPIKEETRG